MTSILTEDTAATLQMMGCLQVINGKESIYVPPDILDDLILRFPMNGLQVRYLRKFIYGNILTEIYLLLRIYVNGKLLVIILVSHFNPSNYYHQFIIINVSITSIIIMILVTIVPIVTLFLHLFIYLL